ncbi:hypothetical protein AAMO2058_001672300 [Amorphochlora amoebiformis]
MEAKDKGIDNKASSTATAAIEPRLTQAVSSAVKSSPVSDGKLMNTDKLESPTVLDSSTGSKAKAKDDNSIPKDWSARKVAMLGASRKQSGEQLKARYSELLLNLTVVASILAAFAYDAFESQTEITKQTEEEKYFVSFCVLSLLSNMLAIIFALYLWDKVTQVEDENMLILIKHYKTLLRVPRWMIMVGGLFFLVLIYIQVLPMAK